MLKSKKLLYFSIETCPRYNSINELSDDEYKAFACKMQRLFNLELTNELYLEKSKLYPEYGKIKNITLGHFKDDIAKLKLIENLTEEDTLKEFQNIISTTDYVLCGWNSKNFDVPWIIKKLVEYDIEVPNNINVYGKTPWQHPVIDLKEIWKMNMDCTLDDACVGFNIPLNGKIQQIMLLANKIKQIDK